MRSLDAYLPEYEFSETHSLAVGATPERVDRAVRELTFDDVPVAKVLFWLRGLGRARRDLRRPLLEQATRGGVLLDDVPGEGVVLGLTGQFWRLRGDRQPRPRSVADFLAYDRQDSCKSVMDFRMTSPEHARTLLSTETRVHVPDPEARRAFQRYWRVIRPFSGLIRILLLRATRRRAEASA